MPVEIGSGSTGGLVHPQACPLPAHEAPGLAESLALAFRDNPLNRAAIRRGRAGRLRANQYGMRATLSAALGRSTILVPTRPGGDADPGLGGLIALPPGGWPLPPPPLLVQIECWLGQGIAPMRRWGSVYRQLAGLHPPGPHWYLLLLGVPEHQRRRGIGFALLEAWLEAVDREGAPAYLETDRPENLSFYRRADFEVVGRQELLGTPIWRMARRAGAGSG